MSCLGLPDTASETARWTMPLDVVQIRWEAVSSSCCDSEEEEEELEDEAGELGWGLQGMGTEAKGAEGNAQTS